MLAYHQIGESPAEGAASRDRIDAIVDNFYAGAPASTTNRNRWKRKNAHPQLVERPPNEETIVDLYEARGRKCRIVSIQDNEEVQRDRLARSNEEVNAEQQTRTMTVHRSMMDSDTAHINNEVELSALEDGLTIE
jgi:hypothetical protein